MKKLTGNEIRLSFLKYFEEHGHRIVKSSPLLPASDPTLLFANAGMNQFKSVFLGAEKRDYTRATTSQKCVRAGGKHNDLEEVGKTARHHTFFEMLGNFSFGDYFKQDAIQFAWDLLVNRWGMEAERLWFSVYTDDDEAFELWKKAGASTDRILRFGEKDNFWSMGETGPCGPCSEIHYFLGDDPNENVAGWVNGPGDTTMEIWNLVFMQFNRDETGEMHPLPRPSVDTGAGLERLAAVSQGARTNYETDLLRPIIDFIAQRAGKKYVYASEEGVSMRVIADHARATAFLITDGIFPGNDGRAYVLRKIMRRALWHGRKLGMETPFFYHVTLFVIELMRSAYPELEDSRATVERVVTIEEKLFASTISGGLKKLEEVIERAGSGAKGGQAVIPGRDAFMLYDTFGLREDLIQYIAEQRNYSVDWPGFQGELEKQRERAHDDWKTALSEKPGAGGALAAQRDLPTDFLGYETLEAEARVTHIFLNGQEVRSVGPGAEAKIVLDRTPFYSEAGGQIGDTGVLEGETVRALVTNTSAENFADASRPPGTIHAKYAHAARVELGGVNIGDRVTARVDAERRADIRPHHTATHLVHAALREVLGLHVKQAGSLVAPDRLRFDFRHFAALTPDEAKTIEDLVNDQILRNSAVTKVEYGLEEALNSGAIAFFGEKYGSRVRIVEVPGFSRELCGGTHVDRTGDIGVFKIVKEESIGAGVRRIEALTGRAALKRFQADEAQLAALSGMLNTSTGDLLAHIERLQAELKGTSREIEQLRLKLAGQASGDAVSRARELGGIRIVAERVADLDAAGMRELADRLLQKLKSGVVVLGRVDDGKAALVVRVSDDLTRRVQAGKIVKELAEMVGGRGGGRPDLAEAGGRSPEKLGDALEASYAIVERLLAPAP